MALTYANIEKGVDVYGGRYVEADVTFSNPYVVGGETVDLAALGLKQINRVELTFVRMPSKNTSTFASHGRQVVPVLTDPAVPKLKVFVSNTTESGAVDQTQVVERVRFIQGR